jgi:hypothetical protein
LTTSENANLAQNTVLDSQTYVKIFQVLDPELRSHFHPDGWLRHPLIIEPMALISHDTVRINEAYQKKKLLRAQAERNGNWSQYVFIHERPYRVRPLLNALRKIRDAQQAAQLVKQVWTDSENLRQHRSAWISIWSKLSNPRQTMDKNEQKKFDALPRRFPIFRGQGGRRGLTSRLSWTIDEAKAEWFAYRFLLKGQRAFVASGWVRKDDVLAYFIERNESEILVMPKKVRDIAITQLASSGFAPDMKEPPDISV